MDVVQDLVPRGAREEWLIAATALLGALTLILGTKLIAPAGRRVPFTTAVVLLTCAALAFGARSLLATPGLQAFFLGAAIIFYALAAARLLFLFAFDGILSRNRREPVPRILRDIAQGTLFFLALLGALHGVGVEPGQLLTTSALLTVVAGMALQETLGNLVAGLAMQGERPFEVGDWIEVHGTPSHIGKVREINWRATRLHTLDNVDVVVPNGLLAKATVTNYDRPHRAARRSVYFHAGFTVPPREVHDVVVQAVREAPGVLAHPPPSLVTFGFDEMGVQFWLRYFIDDMGRRDAIDGGVRDRVWYSLARAGIPLSVPSRTIAMREVSDETEEASVARGKQELVLALSKTELFSGLSSAELAGLAENARSELFAPSEVVIRRGEEGDTMFVVRSGELIVRVDGGHGDIEAARLKAGSFFGEMSLLTGDPRQATIVAATTSELLVIDHAAFRKVLAQHPELAQRISEKVVERQRDPARASIPPLPGDVAQIVEEGDLIDRIRRFFRL